MILTRIFLVLIVIIAIVNESDETHQKGNKGIDKGQDPYRPIIDALKAIRKAEKFRNKSQKKYHHHHKGNKKGYNRPEYRGSSESDESSEEWTPFGFGGPFQSSYPGGPPVNRPYRPSIFESSASASSGGNSGSNGGSGNGDRYPILQPSNNGGGGGGNNDRFPILQGGGNDGPRLPISSGGGGGNNGGGQNPIQQVNDGFSGFLQGLGSLTLGQLLGFPSN